MADLFELTDEVVSENSAKKSTKTAIEPIKLDLGGETRIYIGKNNKQNDYIISKLANEDDLWFHTKDCAGSHVLLKTQNITDELILKCAQLAKKNIQVQVNRQKSGLFILSVNIFASLQRRT